MGSQKTPRYQGRITSWKDDQGFGFISPEDGGARVFLHISAFSPQGIRPTSNDIVTYHLGANEKGPRAEQVRVVGGPAPHQSSPHTKTGLFIATGFLGVVALCIFAEKLPLALFWGYLGASVFAFLVYARDKSAAQNNAWRTSESTLHMLAIVGGWPGALVAQQLLRHKSKKASFLTLFWVTVIINCGALVWLLTPSGANVLRGIFGAP